LSTCDGECTTLSVFARSLIPMWMMLHDISVFYPPPHHPSLTKFGSTTDVPPTAGEIHKQHVIKNPYL
jgi:hypothetical protein